MTNKLLFVEVIFVISDHTNLINMIKSCLFGEPTDY